MINVYLGLAEDFPNIEFAVKYPESKFSAWNFNDGFTSIIEQLDKDCEVNIVSNSSDFLKFIQVQKLASGLDVRFFSNEFNDDNEFVSNKIVEYTDNTHDIVLVMLQGYAMWTFRKSGFFDE